MAPSNNNPFGANPFGDFTKLFSEFKMPNLDMTNIFQVQRRNIEAFSAANQVLAESLQALSRRQTELLQEQIEVFLKTAKDVLSAGTPEAGVAKQADYTKKVVTHSLNSFRELTEMASKSNVEVLDVLSERVVKSFEEIGDAVKKAA